MILSTSLLRRHLTELVKGTSMTPGHTDTTTTEPLHGYHEYPRNKNFVCGTWSTHSSFRCLCFEPALAFAGLSLSAVRTYSSTSAMGVLLADSLSLSDIWDVTCRTYDSHSAKHSIVVFLDFALDAILPAYKAPPPNHKESSVVPRMVPQRKRQKTDRQMVKIGQSFGGGRTPPKTQLLEHKHRLRTHISPF